MNKADSERLESALGQMGLSAANSPEDADVIVINSCVVRQSAEDRVVGMLGTIKPIKERDDEKVVALMGCMVGPKTEALKQRFPQVDVFMRPQQYQPLVALLGARMGIDTEGCVGSLIASPDVASYVPIIHGCDKFCSFCIVPYRRGREVSRTVKDIVSETRLLVKRGVKEVSLLGQNVDSYGHDLSENHDLGDLLEAVSEVDGLERVRFITSHPNDMSDHIIDSIANIRKVCEHVNLPFQAGDDDVLRKMRRGYSSEGYRRLVDKIREKVPKVSLSTDVIVGFCGETEIQFERTLEMVRDIGFDKVHAAAYSAREGTIAARNMDDDVPLCEKQARLKAIEEIQTDIQTEINGQYLDQTVQVLLEGITRGSAQGRTRNNKLVYVEDAHDRIGDVLDVKINKTGPWSLRGSWAPTT